MEIEYSESQCAPKDRRTDALGDLRVLPDEILCAVLVYLTPRDVARLSCVSSVMYIICNEEPLWMSLCLSNLNGQLKYTGSWKKTALDQLNLPNEYQETCIKPMHFDGFNSLFLLRRHYRCYTTLAGFSFDDGNVERRKDLSLEDFRREFDVKKPVLLSGLADTWPAKHTWTIDQLLLKYGDTAFKISQKSARKISMKFKDYVSYMQIQHDEDPLYIFDEKFGEVAPGLLNDYKVPHLFQEDYFDILDREKRPAFRWLIIGPERSGASWHVDPALTSAWNTLLCGRKRWALYPPGRVPLGVTVHVNEEDGDVNIETPSSLQWWLDFYPLLADEDKPIECTQLPGETIFVPSGWWHCVLNLETTVAVTQNFVNSTNFEFVCLDMAPGYQHKGVCRAGLLALDEGRYEDAKKVTLSAKVSLSNSDLTRKEKRIKFCEPVEEPNSGKAATWTSISHNVHDQEFSYDINFLEMFLDKGRDHYNSLWSSSNCIGQREMREWLWKLWVEKPGLRNLIWKGACLALNAGKWSECITEICTFHKLSFPTDDERLPVGMGSNPVYLISDHAIKLYVEGGLEASLHALGSELEFYNMLCKVDSPLKNHIPGVLASGILFIENGSYKIEPWDGKGVPNVIDSCNLIRKKCLEVDFPFGVGSKRHFEFRKAGIDISESISSSECSRIWPYIVTKRCKGKTFADLRDTLSWEDTLRLASFLGEQLHNLHLLPFPSLNASAFPYSEEEIKYLCGNGSVTDKLSIPTEWDFFIRTLTRRKKDVSSRLTKWGDPIPSFLIDKVDEYIPDDFAKFLNIFEDGKVGKPCSWIHSDIMDDNIHMEPSCVSHCPTEHTLDADAMHNSYVNGYHDGGGEVTSWRPSHILDFSDLSIGDPICDLIPIHLDVFRGDPNLLKRFLDSYRLPLARKISQHVSVDSDSKFGRLSYITMCYCILHEENILGAIFSIWRELRTAKSWEEVEDTVWGDLNKYSGFC
ncbi:F-box protein [Actinidia chinensis var. chinensis]|uniref:F-box protein n=1 Tax=Actinidia chinensis var. chinensis TaxID=1590841 RepID=A0A2R6Q0C4_ACTCC|nr:F-box protein [Actinidia chinensis var. chinensis]